MAAKRSKTALISWLKGNSVNWVEMKCRLSQTVQSSDQRTQVATGGRDERREGGGKRGYFKETITEP